MTPSDFDMLSFIKDWLWAPLVGIIGWAWARNQKEHDDLWNAHEKLRDSTSSGHSVLNDRIMEHIDERVSGINAANDKRIDRVNEHITKLFQNAESDRAVFRDALTNISATSSDRHIELLKGQQDIIVALHTGLAGKADK